MTNRKSESRYRFLILASIFLLILVLGVFLHRKSSSTTQIIENLKISEDQNEDESSQYTIPKDVLAAISEAKSTKSPVLGIRSDGQSYKIPIIMYHYVEYVADKNDKGRISLDTPPDILDNEIKTLKDAQYTFINAADLADILDGIKNPPSKPVMLTFDDSYRDFYTDAFPILKKYSAKAVQYVITGSLNTPLHMDESQVREIAQSGLVEIGAHTVNHIPLAGKGEQVREEMSKSKITLEHLIGVPVTAFAYPYGSFDLNSIQAAKQVGFRTAVSTVPGTTQANTSRFFAYRLRPSYLTGQNFLNLVEKN